MIDYQFEQLENELRVLEILKVYSEKALGDYLELSKIYEEVLDYIKKFKSIKYGIYHYKYSREKTLYELLELNLEAKTFKSRCGTHFDFDLYEEILEKVGTTVSIVFLIDSILTETRLRPFIIDDKLKYSTKCVVSSTPEFTLPIKDIKYLSRFMKKTIPEKFHKFNGIKGLR